MRSRLLIASILFVSVTALALYAGGNKTPAGSGLQDLGQTVADRGEKGLLVVRVVEDSPAERAGLKRGDIVLAINGREVNEIADVHKILAGLKAGDWIDVLIRHGDQEKTVRVKLEERLYRPAIGLVFSPPRAAAREKFAPFTGGALIVEVMEGSPASGAGIRRGDIVVSVDRQQLDGERLLSGIVAGHDPGDRIQVEIRRPGPGGTESLEIQVELGASEQGKAFLGVRFRDLPRLPKELSERFGPMAPRRGEGRYFRFRLPTPLPERGPLPRRGGPVLQEDGGKAEPAAVNA